MRMVCLAFGGNAGAAHGLRKKYRCLTESRSPKVMSLAWLITSIERPDTLIFHVYQPKMRNRRRNCPVWYRTGPQRFCLPNNHKTSIAARFTCQPHGSAPVDLSCQERGRSVKYVEFMSPYRSVAFSAWESSWSGLISSRCVTLSLFLLVQAQ